MDGLFPGRCGLVPVGHLAGVQPRQVVEPILSSGGIVKQVSVGQCTEHSLSVGTRHRGGGRCHRAVEVRARKQSHQPIYPGGLGRQGAVGDVKSAAHRHVILHCQGGKTLPFVDHRLDHLADRPPGSGREPRSRDTEGERKPSAQVNQLACRVRLGPRSLPADGAAEQFEAGVGVQLAEVNHASAAGGEAAKPLPAGDDGHARWARRKKRGDLCGGHRVVENHEHLLIDHYRSIKAGQLRKVAR